MVGPLAVSWAVPGLKWVKLGSVEHCQTTEPKHNSMCSFYCQANQKSLGCKSKISETVRKGLRSKCLIYSNTDKVKHYNTLSFLSSRGKDTQKFDRPKKWVANFEIFSLQCWTIIVEMISHPHRHSSESKPVCDAGTVREIGNILGRILPNMTRKSMKW